MHPCRTQIPILFDTIADLRPQLLLLATVMRFADLPETLEAHARRLGMCVEAVHSEVDAFRAREHTWAAVSIYALRPVREVGVGDGRGQ